MLHLGDNKVDLLFIGTEPIYKAYLGDNVFHTGVISANFRYREVDYLNLQVNQWFDTGRKQKACTSMYVEYMPTKENVCNIATTYGKVISQAGRTLELRWLYGAYNNILSPKFGTYVANDNVWIKAYWNVNNKFWMERDGILTTADVYTPEEGKEPNDDNTTNIFVNTGPNNVYKASALYRCFTIWENGVCVLNFVPCIDVITNEYGYYNTVSKKFIRETNGKTITGGPVLENGRQFN